MRYILFKNEDCVMDSIVAVAPKSLETHEADISIENGFGNPTEHDSGGLVFESLELLKHYFYGQAHFAIEATEASADTYKERQKEIKWFMNSLKAWEIKKECDEYGAFQLDYNIRNNAWYQFNDYMEDND